MKIPFTLVAGHVLCTMDDKRVLIDIGSPYTFGRVEAIRFLGSLKHFDVNAPVPTVAEVVAEIRKMPDAPPAFDFDVLVGCDVLAGCIMEIDWAGKTLSISPAPAGTLFSSTREPAELLPIVPVKVNGHTFDAFVDTGARVSYALPECLGTAAEGELATDFVMGFGTIRAALKLVDVEVMGRNFRAAVAAVPSPVERLLRSVGVGGIIGTDLLARTGVCRIVVPPSAEPGAGPEPDGSTVIRIGAGDGAVVIRRNAAPEIVMPRHDPDDEVTSVGLALGVIGMVLGDDELFAELAARLTGDRTDG